MRQLTGKKVAVLATNGFEQSELVTPVNRLIEEGAKVDIVSPEEGEIRGWHDGNWAMDSIKVTMKVENANPAEYTGLVLPGGVMNPDNLRRDHKSVGFVRGFFELGKPVSAICHAPWTLIEAGVVNGRKMTSFSSIRTDLENAGANWVDEEVVVDAGLVTSRHPGDLDAFISKMVEELIEGVHAEQTT
jgi:protease I